MREITCEMCKKVFTSDATNVKYCSDKCRQKKHLQNMRNYRRKVSKKAKKGTVIQRRGKEIPESDREPQKQKEDESYSKGSYFNREYWEDYKASAIRFAEECGGYPDGEVNEIHLLDDDFVDKVLESIQRLGYIRTFNRKVKKKGS